MQTESRKKLKQPISTAFTGGLYRNYLKRPLDLMMSLFATALLSPLLLVLYIIIRIKLGNPVLFKQFRPGLHEKIFRIYKFRTMTNKKDENGELLPDGVRLTRFGRFLRSTSLDELAEFYNIFIGDMSFVGPRPQLIKDMVFMTAEQRQRHDVMPGLTGLAQINGRNDLTWDERLNLDLEYIKHITFWGDMKILFLTLIKVFKREGVNTKGMDTSEDFGDYLLRTGQINEQTFIEGLNKSKAIHSYVATDPSDTASVRYEKSLYKNF